MKTWKVPVSWQVVSTIDIMANTLEEAIEIARDDDGIIPIPKDATFIDGSWEVCKDEDFLRKYYNNNQEDEINNDSYSKDEDSRKTYIREQYKSEIKEDTEDIRNEHI